MSTAAFEGVAPIVLHLTPPLKGMSSAQFLEFARDNAHVRIEMNAEGDLELMPPSGGTAGIRSCKLTGELWACTKESKLGSLFAARTLFELPTGAIRSLGASWMTEDRWSSLTKEQQEGVVPLAPDFVVELRSPIDRIEVLQARMQEYVDAGVRLGWLIDPESKTVWIYEQGKPVSKLDCPNTISGDPVLLGFVLELGPIWDQ